VVKQLISMDQTALEVNADDDNLNPGRLYIGDITSDGFPDILLTIKYYNKETRPWILVNSPCDSAQKCS